MPTYSTIIISVDVHIAVGIEVEQSPRIVIVKFANKSSSLFRTVVYCHLASQYKRLNGERVVEGTAYKQVTDGDQEVFKLLQ